MSLTGKVIVITGSSNGIGKACIQRVARDGASVVINYNRDATSANTIAESIGADRALAVQADISTLAGVDKLICETVAKFGHIDTIMANAGLMTMRTLEQTTEEDFDKLFNINVKGPYFLAQKVVQHMPTGGRIIFVSTGVTSSSGVQPNYLLYAATKGAIEQMTRVMAKELAPKGINVNAIAPGPTGTDLFYNGKPEAVVNAIKGQNPFGRLGEVDEMAGVVNFLSGPDSSWINGQTINVNGGSFV